MKLRTDKPKRSRSPATEFADVYLTRAACGHCGAADLKVYKSYPEKTDGSRTQLARCRSCKKKSRLILELATA
jgi:hypothetical protein